MTAHPLLAVVRGPSGSGKSTVARALRHELGRGSALVEQDHVRRTLLWERDTPGALNIELVDAIARRTLAAGRSTVVEGILASTRYGDMLRALLADHRGPAVCAYLDVPFEETVRRHATRPQAADFTPDEMRAWWLPDDRLGVPGELVLGAENSAADVTRRLLRELGVSAGAATSG
jgi:predicted kinase